MHLFENELGGGSRLIFLNGPLYPPPPGRPSCFFVFFYLFPGYALRILHFLPDEDLFHQFHAFNRTHPVELHFRGFARRFHSGHHFPKLIRADMPLHGLL